MELGLTESQRTLQQGARFFLERECSYEVVRAAEKEDGRCPESLWEQICQQGWLGLVVPEQYGGEGQDFVDLAVLLEEIGRALVPDQVVSTIALGALPILHFGSDQQKDLHLPRIGRGESVFSAALTEPGHARGISKLRTRADRTDSGYELSGEKIFVPAITAADFFLVPACLDDQENDVAVFLVPAKTPGVQTGILKGLAPDHNGQLLLDGVRVGADDVVGKLPDGRAVVEQMHGWAAVALCAEMLGSAQYLLENTVEYAKEREQFGRPIGSFQAVQHHCANMAIDVAALRYMTYLAAWKLTRSEPADMAVSMTKSWCSAGANRVAALAHQVQAGIAFFEEHPVPLYSRRIKVWGMLYGDEAEHAEVVAAHLDL